MIDNHFWLTTYQAIWRNVWKRPNPFNSLEEIKNRLVRDIPLPIAVRDHLGGGVTHITSPYFRLYTRLNKYASLKNLVKLQASSKPLSQNLLPRQPQEVIDRWLSQLIYAGDKALNSTNVVASDNIYGSSHTYNSSHIFGSQKILFSRQLFKSQFVAASHNGEVISYSMRISESTNCSYSFEVSWSSKITRSMFIHDGSDLYECMFCSHVRSKKYCIANVQLGQSEYFRLKEQLVDYLAANNWAHLWNLINPPDR